MLFYDLIAYIRCDCNYINGDVIEYYLRTFLFEYPRKHWRNQYLITKLYFLKCLKTLILQAVAIQADLVDQIDRYTLNK